LRLVHWLTVEQVELTLLSQFFLHPLSRSRTCRRMVSWLASAGNTSCSRSATSASGISDAHLFSTYSNSGLVVPRSQVAAGRKVGFGLDEEENIGPAGPTVE
jgi:hypothetical protein